jgi:hypothetical protein
MPSRIASKTYGTVGADKQKQMNGLAFVQGFADGTLPLNTMARTLGLRYHRSGERARRRYRGAERHSLKCGWHRARRSRSYDAGQLHGTRDPFDFGERRRFHDA